MSIVVTTKPLTAVTLCRGDYRSIHHGRTWEQFKLIQKGFENSRGIRLFYYDGTIEILMPGEAHELFKKIIAILIEAFLLSREIEFKPTGSMTQEKEGIASAEADESYLIGDYKLSIEVNFSSGDTSKLQRYQALGVHEVWFWEDAVLQLYHLRSNGYEPVSQSQIPELVTIDIAVLSNCILAGETSIVKASKDFLAAHRFLSH